MPLTKVKFQGFPGLINRKGDIVFYDTNNTYISYSTSDNLIRAHNSDGWMYFSIDGTPLFNERFSGVSEFINDTAVVFRNDSLIYINRDGVKLQSLYSYPQTDNTIKLSHQDKQRLKSNNRKLFRNEIFPGIVENGIQIFSEKHLLIKNLYRIGFRRELRMEKDHTLLAILNLIMAGSILTGISMKVEYKS